MRNALAALIVATFILGCGQKGPLYHPSDKPAAKKPAPAAAQPSAEPDGKRTVQ